MMSNSTNYTKNKKFWYCGDFETITPNTKFFKEEKDTRVILFSLRNWETEKVEKNGVSIEEFINYLIDLKTSSTVWFHNLSFDGDFIIKYLQNHTKFKLTYDSNKVGFTMFKSGNKIYYIKITNKVRINGTPTKYYIIFRCSLLLLTSGINALGKSFKIKKYDGVDTSKISTFYDREPFKTIKDVDIDYLNYCNRDTLIQLKALKTFDSVLAEMYSLKTYNKYRIIQRKPKFNAYHYLTAGAISWNLLKNVFIPKLEQKNSYIYLRKEDDYTFLKNFYTGGWTQFSNNYQGKAKDVNNGAFVDVNSAYPYQMQELLPYGELLSEEPKDSTFQEFMVIDVISANIKKECENVKNLLNWKRDSFNRYVDRMENFRCYYIKEEFEELSNFYDFKIKKILSFYMKTYKFATQFINELYEKKEYFTKIGNAGFKLPFKILLNSAYGRLGMRAEYESMFYLPSGESHLQNDLINIDKYEYQIIRESDAFNFSDSLKCWVMKKTKKPNKYANVAAASVITAKQRVFLWKTIREMGVDNFIYSDTDSILFKNFDITKINIGEKLGEWDIETRPIKFGSFGAKRYISIAENDKDNKIKFSGLNNNYLQNLDFDYFNFDLDELIFEDGSLKKVKCKSGLILEKSNFITSKGKQ